MNKIFCLETEWYQDDTALLHESSVKSLLDFIKNCCGFGIESTFRQVATRNDFDFYINYLRKEEYDDYDMVYLCFHGDPGKIEFANGQTKTLNSFAYYEKDIFKGRYVHFDSCCTLDKTAAEIREFKKKVGAKIISGFTKEVLFTTSFIFELWLLSTLHENDSITARELNALAKEEMPYYVSNLGFKAY